MRVAFQAEEMMWVKIPGHFTETTSSDVAGHLALCLLHSKCPVGLVAWVGETYILRKVPRKCMV